MEKIDIILWVLGVGFSFMLIMWNNLNKSQEKFEIRLENSLKSFEGKIESRLVSFEGKIEARIVSFEGKIEARIVSFEGKIEARIVSFEDKIESRLGSFENKTDSKFNSLELKVGNIEKEIQQINTKLAVQESQIRAIDSNVTHLLWHNQTLPIKDTNVKEN
jgi:hypothetical protein